MNETVPIRRVARVLNGGTPRPDADNWGGDVPWATPVDLAQVDGGDLAQTDRTLTPLGLTTGSTLAPADTILLSTRAPIGYTARTARPTAFNQGCKALVPAEDITSRFLQLCLIAGREDLRQSGQGSTFAELSNESLLAALVPLPSLAEQLHIADYLDDQVARIDSVITARARQRELLSAGIRTALTDLLLSDESADRVPIKRMIIDERIGIWGTEAGESEVDVRVVRVADFDRQRFVAETPGTVRSTEQAKLSQRILRPGDVLLERSGGTQRNPVGCPAYIHAIDGPTVSSNFVSRLRPNEATDGRYLSLALGAMYWTRRQEPFSTQTTGIQNLDSSFYMLSTLPERSLVQQSVLSGEADRMIDDVETRKQDLYTSAELLKEYKQSLITAAVSGEFDVSTASGRGVPVTA